MKFRFSMLAASAFSLVCLSLASAQCNTPAPAGAGVRSAPPATLAPFNTQTFTRTSATRPAAIDEDQIQLTKATARPITREEAEFLATGPRLFPMNKALALTQETGKPTVCWMGKNLFADPDARELSASLGDTTIQAAMEGDGTKFDSVGPRVKFSSNGLYNGDSKVYTIALKDFKKKGTAEEILRISRGGEPTFKQK
jgi:hypothetical protein